MSSDAGHIRPCAASVTAGSVPAIRRALPPLPASGRVRAGFCGNPFGPSLRSLSYLRLGEALYGVETPGWLTLDLGNRLRRHPLVPSRPFF